MKSVSFVLLIMMGVVGVSTSALAAFDRSLEPVIVVGSQLPAFLGKSTDGVRVYAYSGGVWQPMPFQIDDFKAKEGELDEKEIDWEGHETLLSLDEVVFMAKDVGDRAGDDAWPQDVEARDNARYEIALTDPLTADSAYAYIYYSTTLATSGASYVAYTNDEAKKRDYVKTSIYTIGHGTDDASGLPDSLVIRGTNIDVLDSWRLRIFVDEIIASVSGVNVKNVDRIYITEDMNTTAKLQARISGLELTVTATIKASHNSAALQTIAGPVRLVRRHVLNILITVPLEPLARDVNISGNIPITTSYYENYTDFKPSFTLDLGDRITSLKTDHIEFATGYNANLMQAKFYGEGFTLERDGSQDSLVNGAPANNIFRKILRDADWPGAHWYGFSGQSTAVMNNASFFTLAELFGSLIKPGDRDPRFFYYDYKSDNFEKTPKIVYGVTGLRIYDWDKTPEQSIFEIDARYRNYYFAENHTRAEFQTLFNKYKTPAAVQAASQVYIDTIKPGRVTDLAIAARTDTSMTLKWTAPGNDDDSGGPASYYIIRYSTAAPTLPDGQDYTWWSGAMNIPNPPIPAEPGTEQTLLVSDLAEATTYYFRLNVVDKAGNSSGLSNTASTWTTPVELAGFTAVQRGRDVQLRWTTLSETNNIGFAVERRSTAEKWREIGFVAGAGTTVETQHYSFLDATATAGEWHYRLGQKDADGAVTYSQSLQVSIAMPQEFALQQNYPNPFNPETTISFQVPESAGRMALVIYDMLGRQLRTLVDGEVQPGYYNVKWDGKDDAGTMTSSGVYIYRLSAGEFSATKKMIKLQ